MHSLGQDVTAVVIGASGGIGAALTRALADDPAIARIHALSRSGSVPDGRKIAPGHIDLADGESLADAARRVAAGPAPRLVIVASGLLHGDGAAPEKSWRELKAPGLAQAFLVNATGPALAARHFLEIMPRRERSIFAALSARVGSIGDNQAGGWYGYRASKAALNQILRCLAIEARTRRPGAVIAGLQPGTVATELSAPFRRNVAPEDLFTPDQAAANLLAVLDQLPAEASGGVYDWRGEAVPA